MLDYENKDVLEKSMAIYFKLKKNRMENHENIIKREI